VLRVVNINHPPINLLDEVLSQEFDRLGRELEADEAVRAEGLLVEAPASDLSVANEVTQARVTEALTVGAETYEGELELDFISSLSQRR
jgi:hypothetical protein